MMKNNLIFVPNQSILTDSSIIAIPGYGTPSVPTWSLETQLEMHLKDLEGIGRIHIFSYNYDSVVEGSFSWQMLLDRGNELLTLLLESRQQQACSTQNQQLQRKQRIDVMSIAQ
jgi:hypothetical protein